MKNYLVRGGKKLNGTVKVSGSKNAALPIMCGALLTKEKVTLTNIPDIADIHSMIEIFRALGVQVEFANGKMEIDPSKLKSSEIPAELTNSMRASILVIGSLLPRLGEVKMSFPGGCVLGKRSVEAHTHAFKALGAEVIDDKSGLHLKAGKLKGKKIILPELSVTATENAVMAAVLASGKTEIRLSAAEPHVQDLCNFLKKMGAKISGIGTNNIQIEGVKSLKGAKYAITGDYLEAGTFAICAAATGGDVKVEAFNPDDLDSVWQKFKEMGVDFEIGDSSVHIKPSKNLKAVKMLRTAVFPSFPTDLQAPFTVLLTQARGVSKVFETLCEGRLNYLFELEKMGAHVEFMNPHQALIIGKAKLRGVPISSWDIRAGAAMVVAALIAEGDIDRGYENFEEKLRSLGADIHRFAESNA